MKSRYWQAIWAVAFHVVATAQQTPPPAPAAASAPEDPFGRNTPSGTVRGFLVAVDRGDFAKAGQYLDIVASPARTQELAQQLGAVLDYGVSENIDHLSRSPDGDLRDGEEGQDRLGVVETASGRLEIMLARVERRGQTPIWQFSSSTLRRIPRTFDELDEPWFLRNFPIGLREKKFFGTPLWRWISILLGILVALASATLASRIMLRLAKPVARYAIRGHDVNIDFVTGPMRVLFLALAIRLMSGLSVSLLSRQLTVKLSGLLFVVGFTWLIICLVDAFSVILARGEYGQPGKLSILSLGKRLIKIIVVFVGAIVVLHTTGVNVTAMLAGLGVGGIALALAAQKTLENLLGGISIIMRESIRVGDFCNLGTQTGTIEDIGLSATKVRTLDRTVISVPNAQLSQINLENISMRDKFWFHHLLSLRRDATPDQLRQIFSKVDDVLRKHPKIETDSLRMNLLGFGTSSLDTEIFAYVYAADWVDFLRIQQTLLLSVMDVVAASGTSLALPSQTTYLERVESA